MGIAKQMLLEEMFAERCELCRHWITPGRAAMDEHLTPETCSKCDEFVSARNNCSATNMGDYLFEPIEAD